MNTYTITTVNQYYNYNNTKVYRPKKEFEKNLIELKGKKVYLGEHFKPQLVIGAIKEAFFVGDKLQAILDIKPIYQSLITGFSIGFYAQVELNEEFGLQFINVHYDHLLITDTPRCGAVCKV
jgi:hypothetical protein